MKLILKTSTRTYVSTYICKYNNQRPARCNIWQFDGKRSVTSTRWDMMNVEVWKGVIAMNLVSAGISTSKMGPVEWMIWKVHYFHLRNEEDWLIHSIPSKMPAFLCQQVSNFTLYNSKIAILFLHCFLSLKDSFILGDHLMLNAEYHFGVGEICWYNNYV